MSRHPLDGSFVFLAVDIIRVARPPLNYSNAYAQALLVGTPAEQLTGKKPTRLTRGLSPEEVARLEKEMESLETELRAPAAQRDVARRAEMVSARIALSAGPECNGGWLVAGAHFWAT